ncbi:unnamed protein product [Prorocentrum cordatum]|uniref:Uncharacterized protein n=1 Tax=Prorocentrum cordatum TaxID=2364126 RepID=A0ABN9UGT3_9DINO|nr:unnamed protein product [Polarella glacialis]
MIRLPLQPHQLRQLAGACVLAAVTWPLVLRSPTQKQRQGLDTMLSRTVRGDQWRSRARPLQQLLLVGHTADFSLRLLDRIWTLMDARIRRRGAAYVEDAFKQFWMKDKRTAGVMQAVDAAMGKLCFLMMLDDQDHVIWKAPPEADGAEISLTSPKDARDYLIREVWRKRLWTTFLGSRTRRDSAAGRHAQAPYCPRAIRAALGLTKASEHEIAILTGAFFSNARLAKIKGLPVPKCFGCDLDEDDDAAHTFWRCPRLAHWRRFVAIPPNPEWPVWPTRLLRSKKEVEEFKQRIHYMASVRQCILHQRHRRTDAEGEQAKSPRRTKTATAEVEKERMRRKRKGTVRRLRRWPERRGREEGDRKLRRVRRSRRWRCIAISGGREEVEVGEKAEEDQTRSRRQQCSIGKVVHLASPPQVRRRL